MSSRRSRPPRGRKSKSPEALPSEVPVIIPPAGRSVDMGVVAATSGEAPRDELAALEAGWDELLLS
ncbi:MAG: hypothetical protein ACRENE_25335 [Polyangiaceae bacterium]